MQYTRNRLYIMRKKQPSARPAFYSNAASNRAASA